jgi:hypothetical protein
MPSTFRQWEREFRKAAKADHLSAFREHLRRFDLPDKPELLVNGTVYVVQACIAYATLDQNSFDAFLALQKYDPAEAKGAVYVFTFDLHERAFARILVPADIRTIDLADLYGHPWWAYEVVGYDSFWITRVDERSLAAGEKEKLEKAVLDDLRFDYADEELNVWSNEHTKLSEPMDGAFHVMLQNIEMEDTDDGEE